MVVEERKKERKRERKKGREKVNDDSGTIVSERHQWRTHTLGPIEKNRKWYFGPW